MKLLLILLYLFFFNGEPDLTIGAKERLMKKTIKKVFKTDQYQLEEISEFDLNNETRGSFNKVYSNTNFLAYCYLGRVNTCRIGGCEDDNYIEGKVNFESEYFDYFIFYNEEGKVLSIRIYDYNATYGYEVCSNFWLKQFIDYDNSKEAQIADDIDGISGATISVDALTNEIIDKTRLIDEYIDKNHTTIR